MATILGALAALPESAWGADLSQSDLSQTWIAHENSLTPSKLLDLMPIIRAAGYESLIERAVEKMGARNFQELADTLIFSCTEFMNPETMGKIDMPTVYIVPLGKTDSGVWSQPLGAVKYQASLAMFTENWSRYEMHDLRVFRFFGFPKICLRPGLSQFASAMHLTHELFHFLEQDTTDTYGLYTHRDFSEILRNFHNRKGGEIDAFVINANFYIKLEQDFDLSFVPRPDFLNYFNDKGQIINREQFSELVFSSRKTSSYIPTVLARINQDIRVLEFLKSQIKDMDHIPSEASNAITEDIEKLRAFVP